MIYRADLHIHTVLSPCGDLEMSPVNIINKAVEQKLDVIGITDHNSTLHGPLIRKLGERNNILVITGAEVTTKEDVHCLTFFENDEILGTFQHYLEKYLPPVKNKPSAFGYQVVVDEQENILEEIDNLLLTGLTRTIEEVEEMVHQLGGLFIPAHINKKANSLLENLGFLPPGLKVDAVEVTGNTEVIEFRKQHPEFNNLSILKNSDAHHIDFVGKQFNEMEMESLSFEGFKNALLKFKLV